MKAEITLWDGLFLPQGKRLVTTWDEWFVELSKPRPYLGKEDHPGWSAAVFDDAQRGKEYAQYVTAACLDYDSGTPEEEILAQWSGYYGLLHTTRSHTEEHPRFRLVLPLSRFAPPNDWEPLWLRIQAHTGSQLDESPKDASRFWYLPGIKRDGEFYARRLKGEPLDVDKWLSRPDPTPVRPKPEPVVHTADVMKRASAYLAKCDPSIAGSGGNAALWRASVAIGRGFDLNESEVLQLLASEFNPRCQPPWPTKVLERHAKRSTEDSTLERGYLLGPEQEFEQPRHFEGAPAPDLSSDPDPREEEPISETRQAAPKPSGAVSMYQMLEAVVQTAESGAPVRGVSMCHPGLDKVSCGFRRRRITVLGAQTSFGKTSYTIAVADESMVKVADQSPYKVAFVSVEDDAEMFGQRFIARRARINAARLRANKCKPAEMKAMRAQLKWAQHVPFFIDGIGKTVEDICTELRAYARDYDPDLVIFDYLQRAKTKVNIDRRNQVTFIAQVLGDTLKEINSSGLVISQIKRPDPNKPDRRPTLHDLKESGDVENMAEHVLMGHVEGTGMNARRFLHFEKNKDGPLDNSKDYMMPFDTSSACFDVPRGWQDDSDEFEDEFDDFMG